MTCRSMAAGLALLAVGIAGACREAPRVAPGGTRPITRVQDEQQRAAQELATMEHDRLGWPDDRARFKEAAQVAWTFLNGRIQPKTGLVVGPYPYATLWDIGSMIAAVHSARGLDLIDDAEYQTRTEALLATLKRIPLYENTSFNKAYDSRTGAPYHPFGVSTTDLGRLLIWLKILAADPRFKESAEAVVQRTKFDRLVRAGYLWGESLEPSGRRQEYQEGTVGYEQYAAQGFALWEHRADKALRLKENALPISVMGQPLMADYRRWDRLTPEPFLLWGLEVGWDPPTAAFVRRLLLAQEARFKKTGHITIVGEDAIDLPPDYFYYYCVYANGRDFAVDSQDRSAVTDSPRWISSKSAFAFHALMPTAYTERAVQAIGESGHVAGGAWASGVFEGTGESTGNSSINTAAVILTAALVNHLGKPVLAQARQPSRQ